MLSFANLFPLHRASSLPVIVILLLLSHNVVGQDRIVDFNHVDSFARSVAYKGDIRKLTEQLTVPYSEQLFKLRSIFTWITNHIEYDYKFVNKEKEIKTPDCTTGAVCEQMWRDWENAYLHRVLKKKKAICDGYARLFQKMCVLSGMKNEIITGYTKVKPYQIGTYVSVNHAWNAVWLDSAYYFFDLTWAAGGCAEDEETGKLLNFRKKFNEYYWMTSFKDLSRNHYPKDGKWVMEANYTKEKFTSNPYYAPWAIHKINLKQPVSGIIDAKIGDTIRFSIEYAENVDAIQVNSNEDRNPSLWIKQKSKRMREPAYIKDPAALDKQCYILFQRKENMYEFDYVLTKSSIYYLDILFDYERIMRFKVKAQTFP